MSLEGKIAVRDGKVYFASGYYLTSEEGVYVTNYWRLNCPENAVMDGEIARGSGGVVKVDKPRGFGVRSEWRICNPDGTTGGGGSPAAFSEDTKIPRPQVRKGVDVHWGLAGWEKWSKKERGWIPA